MTEDSLPEQFPAWAAWSALTEAEKVEVARLAKRAQPHPDRRVEQAACGWAAVLLGAAEVEHQDRWWNRLWAPLEPLFGFDDWLERRAIRAGRGAFFAHLGTSRSSRPMGRGKRC